MTGLIAFTGYGSTDDITASREAGFDDPVVKPIALDRLLSALDLQHEYPALVTLKVSVDAFWADRAGPHLDQMLPVHRETPDSVFGSWRSFPESAPTPAELCRAPR